MKINRPLKNTFLILPVLILMYLFQPVITWLHPMITGTLALPSDFLVHSYLVEMIQAIAWSLNITFWETYQYFWSCFLGCTFIFIIVNWNAHYKKEHRSAWLILFFSAMLCDPVLRFQFSLLDGVIHTTPWIAQICWSVLLSLILVTVFYRRRHIQPTIAILALASTFSWLLTLLWNMPFFARELSLGMRILSWPLLFWFFKNEKRRHFRISASVLLVIYFSLNVMNTLKIITADELSTYSDNNKKNYRQWHECIQKTLKYSLSKKIAKNQTITILSILPGPLQYSEFNTSLFINHVLFYPSVEQLNFTHDDAYIFTNKMNRATSDYSGLARQEDIDQIKNNQTFPSGLWLFTQRNNNFEFQVCQTGNYWAFFALRTK